ncbi:hypothetical protein HDC90_000693 [Pedobacter sp. AK013]|uniref:hypothetical protein n=1 Tax=Pedobacter sp. AK013 TaxID=2723071 RepID=UPI00161FAF85|nr:hypothetical protein [Pedobacter sp. AK013]MBB6236087.1 hypothetical protein [Pedobacter sp. AK013]
MKTINKNNNLNDLTKEELIKIEGGKVGPGDAAYSVGYGAAIAEVMLVGGIIPAGYLTYKWAERMFN